MKGTCTRCGKPYRSPDDVHTCTPPRAVVLANDRPTRLDDDLYQWAIDAEDELRRLYAENEALRSRLQNTPSSGESHEDSLKSGDEALRLAEDLLDHYAWHSRIYQAAGELRRLHAENEALKAAQYECGFGAGCCYQAVRAEKDTSMLRQALEALERGETKLRFATIAALRERLGEKT